jgi:hypothetical protein
MDHYAIAPRAVWHDQRLNGSMVWFTAWWHSTGAPQVRGNVDGPSDQGQERQAPSITRYHRAA